MIEEEKAVEKRYLNKEDFTNFVNSYHLVWNKTNKLYLVELKKEFVIVERVGFCDYKKCKNACCKFCSAGYVKDYSKGFFDKEDDFGNLIMNKPCNNLKNDGTCALWGKRSTKNSSTNKGFPIACKQFPHVADSIYWNVVDICSFKYEVLFSIKKPNEEKIRKEMIENFRRQYKCQ